MYYSLRWIQLHPYINSVQSYKHFTLVNYDSRVVIYECKMFLRLASAYFKMSLCRSAIVQPLEHHHAQLLPLLVGRQLGRQLDRLLHQGIKVQGGVLLTREQTCQKMQFCKIKNG